MIPRAAASYFLLVMAGLLPLGQTRAADIEILPPGHRPAPPSAHALVGARVFVKPGQVLEGGTILLRDGLIQSAGTNIPVPPDARVWDLSGYTVYAGFIESLAAPVGETRKAPDAAEPEFTAGGPGFFGVPGTALDKARPGAGSPIPGVNPEKRMAQTYVPDPKLLESLRELGFTAANFASSTGVFRGTSTLLLLSDEPPNKAILRPDTFQHVSFSSEGGGESAYPRSLMGMIAVVRQTLLDARHYSLDWAHYEQHLGTRTRPEVNPALAALQPVLKKEMTVFFEPGSALMVDRAAQLAREFDFNLCLLSSGQEWRRPELARSANAVFVTPVNFPEAPKFADTNDWTAVSLDQLRAWDWAPENAALLRRQNITIALTTDGLADKKKFRPNLRMALDRGLSEDDALAALTTVPARICGMEARMGSIEPGKLANLTVVKGTNYFDPASKVTDVWIEGRIYRLAAGLSPAAAGTNDTKLAEARKDAKNRDILKQRVAQSPLSGRGVIANPPVIFIHKATIWTSTDAGRLTNGQMLVESGRITGVGTNLTAPENAFVIDAGGKNLTAGVIDCHSHSMILGAVNEGTLPSTAMVRISDVVNSETRRIYEQLAGGVTTANQLHGSANPIGGQNCVIKLRDGALPEAMKFGGAPAGIKFALGENVKQSNWGERNATRFPQTRMGVQTFLANRFTAAERYRNERQNRPEGAAPFRTDLELEAIAEILEGTRWIHCHSYRQDEILMFLRLMESFQVRVGTLQHILEGYKIADEIARHGAGASCFSDWWAYKFEVYDAIPYAGSLMRERGVVVSFNSDSSDLARRLYLEAAKAVKYGQTSEEEALKFVTLNPAKQLRIDRSVGSLEAGKDADFVIWSKSPLDASTVCLETWIDGKKYFDRAVSAERAKSWEKERQDLIKKARSLGGTSPPADDKALSAFFHPPLELRSDGIERHCDE